MGRRSLSQRRSGDFALYPLVGKAADAYILDFLGRLLAAGLWYSFLPPILYTFAAQIGPLAALLDRYSTGRVPFPCAANYGESKMTNRSKPGHHVTLLNFRRFVGSATKRGPIFQCDTKTDNYLTKTGQKNLGDHALITAFGGPACLPVFVFDICRVDRAFFPGRLFVEHGDKIDGIFSIVGVQ